LLSWSATSTGAVTVASIADSRAGASAHADALAISAAKPELTAFSGL
jgi:hypothetical protein